MENIILSPTTSNKIKNIVYNLYLRNLIINIIKQKPYYSEFLILCDTLFEYKIPQSELKNHKGDFKKWDFGKQ